MTAARTLTAERADAVPRAQPFDGRVPGHGLSSW
ncbi:hypothetical protein B0I32_108208 [Nonomuraea fuscirosea]|uniref:Uncharacterized protein n=1 Tax=Nonomuraea fuscirosea TaxID=1291556 RepID=A0A2T0MZP5_9ACTN|nr:hypothetical protein B0I32_108208 [Nonomuraea fuscirosea]